MITIDVEVEPSGGTGAVGACNGDRAPLSRPVDVDLSNDQLNVAGRGESPFETAVDSEVEFAAAIQPARYCKPSSRSASLSTCGASRTNFSAVAM